MGVTNLHHSPSTSLSLRSTPSKAISGRQHFSAYIAAVAMAITVVIGLRRIDRATAKIASFSGGELGAAPSCCCSRSVAGAADGGGAAGPDAAAGVAENAVAGAGVGGAAAAADVVSDICFSACCVQSALAAAVPYIE